MKNSRSSNKYEKHKKACEEYILANPEKVKESKQKYKLNNIDKVRKSARDWNARNIEHIRAYQKNRLKNDINFNILSKMRNRLYKSIISQGIRKHVSTTILLGCTIKELKIYIESKFLPTMTWENYGKYWHIDHIIPCSSFDLSKTEEQQKCFHYSNLQPLFAVTQLIDGVEYIGNINKNNRLVWKKKKLPE